MMMAYLLLMMLMATLLMDIPEMWLRLDRVTCPVRCGAEDTQSNLNNSAQQTSQESMLSLMSAGECLWKAMCTSAPGLIAARRGNSR
eukprot:SAG22_NODE_2962_length_2069_cov_1.488325_2_plen_87_part_00